MGGGGAGDGTAIVLPFLPPVPGQEKPLNPVPSQEGQQMTDIEAQNAN
jgi:hypothetical protein